MSDASTDLSRDWRDEDPSIIFTPEEDGRSTRVELRVEGRSVSRCWIVRQRIRVGRSVLRMDGIGGVGTDPEHRLRGYSARVLRAALRRMRAGDAVLTMLYGIPNYYERFGYVQAGPEHVVVIMPALDAVAPDGWQVRPGRPEDLPALRQVYDAATENAVGTAVRAKNAYVWRTLEARLNDGDTEECFVAATASGRIGGYLRRGAGFWAVDVLQRDEPGHMVMGEAIAVVREAAEALVAWCARRAALTGGTAKRPILLPVPHDSLIAAAAMRFEARLYRVCARSGNSMANVLDPGGLLAGMGEELSARVQRSRLRQPRTLRLQTDGSAVLLQIREDAVSIEPCDDATTEHDASCRLSTQDLARLALGALPPEEILERSHVAGSVAAVEVLCALFPLRCPHMYLPDRY